MEAEGDNEINPVDDVEEYWESNDQPIPNQSSTRSKISPSSYIASFIGKK